MTSLDETIAHLEERVRRSDETAAEWHRIAETMRDEITELAANIGGASYADREECLFWAEELNKIAAKEKADG